MKVGIIDPVGSKAGIDHYSVLVLTGMKEAGCIPYLYSNFNYTGSTIRYSKVFTNTNVSKVKAVSSNFFGFIRALRAAKKEKVEWLILHIFRAGFFDLFMFSLARVMGFRIAAIVHDIESLDTLKIPLVRSAVIHYLPNIRIVHNAFSKAELGKSVGEKGLENTVVIPHVNFTDIFSKYYNQPALEKLKQSTVILSGLHPLLPVLVQQKKPLLLFFGQIKKAKGLHVLLEALPQCQSDFTLVIAGKLRNENWSKYDSVLSVFNLHDRVLPVIRHISDEERDVLFACSNGIVLPYTHIYQSGVLLMAMSFPIVAVASDLPANTDFIQHGKNGFLFKSEDARDLAKQIDTLFAHPEASELMRLRALTDVQDNCNANKIGKQFAAALSEFSK